MTSESTGQMRANVIKVNVGLTSRVMMNESRHSFTNKNTSGSVSLFRLDSMACVSRPARDTQSSSISRSLRNERVVRNTSRSIMKKPVISCVRAGRETRLSGVGRMRSDCA